MILQISSGQGPSECELAVSKLYNSLESEYPDIEIISWHPGREKKKLRQRNAFFLLQSNCLTKKTINSNTRR